MGFYRDRILPRVIDAALGNDDVGAWRAEVLEGATGRVVEIGFGSGLNMAYYPSGVTEVLAVEPSKRARELAADRVRASGITVQHVGLDGQRIPLEDQSCDTAVCTFTLCTVPQPSAALAEVHRVLRPGGRFHFLEHGGADEPDVQKWQRRVEPLQRRLFDGCHLTRRPVELVEAAGFRIERSDSRYASGPRPWSWFTAAVAVRD